MPTVQVEKFLRKIKGFYKFFRIYICNPEKTGILALFMGLYSTVCRKGEYIFFIYRYDFIHGIQGV